MNFTKRKNKVIFKLKTIGTMVTLFAIKANMVFATEGASSGIGTAEVTQATDNIKRVTIQIHFRKSLCHQRKPKPENIQETRHL